MATTNYGLSKRQVSPSFTESVYKLWPWIKGISSEVSREELDKYYELTYAFGEDSWKDRLIDGTDEDESQRELFVILLCLEFKFDGSSPSKPSPWTFWRRLHKEVICPCFKARKPEEVVSRYISWPSKTFKLDEGIIRIIWHKVYDNNNSTAEEDWISENFHAWMLADRKHFIENTEISTPELLKSHNLKNSPSSKKEQLESEEKKSRTNNSPEIKNKTKTSKIDKNINNEKQLEKQDKNKPKNKPRAPRKRPEAL